MEQLEEKVHDAVADLEVVAQEVKPPEAWRSFGDLTLEKFWQAWPGIRAWGEWMWQLIENERGSGAAPAGDPDLDESGTAG